MSDEPTPTPEQEAAVREMLDGFDRALGAFMRLTMPPGTQFVMVLGGENKSGAVVSNVEDREVMLEFLTVAGSKLRQ